jgi:hypothetical protein
VFLFISNQINKLDKCIFYPYGLGFDK